MGAYSFLSLSRKRSITTVLACSVSSVILISVMRVIFFQPIIYQGSLTKPLWQTKIDWNTSPAVLGFAGLGYGFHRAVCSDPHSTSMQDTNLVGADCFLTFFVKHWIPLELQPKINIIKCKRHVLLKQIRKVKLVFWQQHLNCGYPIQPSPDCQKTVYRGRLHTQKKKKKW